MKILMTIKENKNVKYLRATMGVCYYVDCKYSIDGGNTWEEDFDDTDEESERIKNIIPCVVKKDIGYRPFDYWEILIDLDTGEVLNWPKDFCLNTWFKICDDGEYVFLDENMNEIINITKEYEQYYVPDFLSIEDEGYGDYCNINIDSIGGTGYVEHFDKMKSSIKDYFETINDED